MTTDIGLHRPDVDNFVLVYTMGKVGSTSIARSLADVGIWDYIVRRYADTGRPEVVRECERCFAELEKLEREEVVRAIRGENYETIWGQRGVAERVAADPGGLETALRQAAPLRQRAQVAVGGAVGEKAGFADLEAGLAPEEAEAAGDLAGFQVLRRVRGEEPQHQTGRGEQRGLDEPASLHRILASAPAGRTSGRRPSTARSGRARSRAASGSRRTIRRSSRPA